MEVGGSETAKGDGAKTREAEGKECERLEAAMLLAFKTEDRTMNQGAQAASGSWERQENRLYSRAPEGMRLRQHLEFNLGKTISKF